MSKKYNWFSICPLKKFYEDGKLEEHWIKDYCWGDYKSCIRYQLEEEANAP